MNNDMDENKVVSEKTSIQTPKKPDKKVLEKREMENFKRKYFDYYDDIKISVREDW